MFVNLILANTKNLGDTFAVFSKFFSAAQCIALSLNVAVV
jgi:hypothetical protein